jgi:hypothetical protein
MKRLGALVLSCCIFVGPASYGQQPDTASIVSAYQGSASDWALGRWKGNAYNKNASRTGSGLNNFPFTLVFEKQPDGKVLCTAFAPGDETPVRWGPTCVIDADRIVFTAPKGTYFELARKGEKLEGTAKATGTLPPLYAEASR